MPRIKLQIGRKEDIPIIIQACEKIKQMIAGFHRNSGFLLFFARKKLQKNYLQFAGNYGIINKINREIIHHFWMVCNFVFKIYKK